MGSRLLTEGTTRYCTRIPASIASRPYNMHNGLNPRAQQALESRSTSFEFNPKEDGRICISIASASLELCV